MTTILMSTDAPRLAAALAAFPRTATVEAEYGDVLVGGSITTLAHHGMNSGNLCPCLLDNMHIELDAIGLSHLDLDALGGVLALMGQKPHAPDFWELAAFVDIYGPHKLPRWEQFTQNPAVVAQLFAYWAWARGQSRFKMGELHDVTSQVEDSYFALMRIFAGDTEMLAAGEKMREEEDKLNAATFVEADEEVCIRVTPGEFCNHLYRSPTGIVSRAVVAYSTISGAITVSFADKTPGVSARAVVQALFGPEAGGHDGIAGSPRNQRMSFFDIARTIQRVKETLN